MHAYMHTCIHMSLCTYTACIVLRPKVIFFFQPPTRFIGRSPRKPAPRPTSWRASHKTWAPCGPTSATTGGRALWFQQDQHTRL